MPRHLPTYPDSPYRVAPAADFAVASAPTVPPEDAPSDKECKKRLKKLVDELDELQRVFYARNHHALLCVFQAMDAAGKDSTIRSVLSGVNPAGFQVFSFKKPSDEELDHDFLWRTTRALPERGRIGVFNRSYYEEVLVVRVHPEYLKHQRLHDSQDPATLWEHRFESIRSHEEHLARNGTIILKFWLNVSKQEQKARLLSRIEEKDKNWKFEHGDLAERAFWDDYMGAYEQCIRATSTQWAPWYAIPADSKPFMRMTVAEILVQTLQSLDLKYPKIDGKQRALLEDARRSLEDEE